MTPVRFVGAVLLYSALVFCVGFAFEVARDSFIETRWGISNAEIARALALASAIFASGWITARSLKRASWEELFVAGIVSTALVVFLDVLIGAEFRGQTPEQLLFKRDSLEGALYYALVGLCAVAPAAFSLRRPASRSEDHVE